MSQPADSAADQDQTRTLLPGATLGVFGGGQLGRMFTQAAQRMGYRVCVFSPEAGSPAGVVADEEHVGSYDDPEAVAAFARKVGAATLEFENVPTDSVAAAEAICPVRPGAKVLHTTQHRVREKTFLQGAGTPVGPFAPVRSLEELHAAAASLGLPAVLKTAELGYDGKGQRVLREASELDAAWESLGLPAGRESLGGAECIYEAFVDFAREVSVIVARSADGEMVLYGPIENDHANHILDVSVYPATAGSVGGDADRTRAEAHRIATRIAERIDLVGLLCVEMFQRADGSLLVNELAPRPHNSGHLTIEGSRTSQFEQQVRAVAGLPLGSAESVAPAAMANLLGDLWFDEEGTRREPDWPAALAAGASLHLYGKRAPAPGRKMGHLTVLADTPEAAQAAARAARGRV